MSKIFLVNLSFCSAFILGKIGAMSLWCRAYSLHYKNNNQLLLSWLEFQKRVLQLLVDIRDTIHVATSSAGTSYEVKPANTEEEFQALENCLEDESEGAELVSFKPQVVLGSDYQAMETWFHNSNVHGANVQGLKFSGIISDFRQRALLN